MKRLCLLALLASCASPPPPAPTPVPVATATASATATATPPSNSSANGLELAVGEAILIEGSANGGPSNDSLDTLSLGKNKLVVMAKKEGEATILFNDASGALTTRGFRIVAELCRDTPLHPVVLVEPDGHADVTATAQRVEAFPLSAAYARMKPNGKLGVFGAKGGHGSVIAQTPTGDVQLFDVFVGDACAAKHYTSIAPSIPPGSLGPKGDGTCVRRTQKGATPYPCPDPKTLESMQKEDFSSLACEWASSCDRQGVEGCCVGCTNPFAMKLERKCALKALHAKTCTDVQKILDTSGCLH